MRAFHNLAVSACLLSLVAVNLASNPFLLQVWAQSETSCEGSPPSPDGGCCEECGCWICECT